MPVDPTTQTTSASFQDGDTGSVSRSQDGSGASRKQDAESHSTREHPEKIESLWRLLVSATWHGAGRLRRKIGRQWRTSLQLRTVVTTLVIASIAVVGVGAYLSGQIANGLFKERLAESLQDATRGAGGVQEAFSSAIISEPTGLAPYVRDELSRLNSAGVDDGRRYILVKAPNQSSRNAVSSADSGGLTIALIPETLRQAVQNDPKGQFWQSMPLPVGATDTHPAVAVGTIVELQQTQYELYLLYDLDNAQTTLNYIQSVLWLAGGILLLLIGVITWYVTRTVVRPVSQAAAVSEKLAAGGLEERMKVDGEDEMARLATSFNKMATSLQEQINALESLSVMQQRFVSDVSHELRTPLTTVRMAAEVLYSAREDFDPVNKRSSELLLHQVERFELLLADLLEISRFDAGAATLDAESLDIFSVIHSVIEGAMPVADANKSELSVVTRLPGHKCVAEIDARRVDRILRNLVVNALEHSEGNPVKIFVSADEHAVAVAVRDYGIGMSPDALDHVFDRFWRADPARARTTGGSGLGLSIAMEDTRLHGGWLQAWGSPGKGSCFRLTLPLVQGTEFSRSPVPLPPDGGGVAAAAKAFDSGPILTNTGAMGVVGALGSVSRTIAHDGTSSEPASSGENPGQEGGAE